LIIFLTFIKKKKEISFYGDTAELVNQKGQKKTAKRQALDGLWIEYAWSVTNAALHIRINRVQIDNQLDYTMFPVVLYPIVSKLTGTDLAEKPFIELSVYESKTTRSNVMQFKYFKLLIQEFAVKIDQGLIVAILAFLRQEKVCFLIEFFFFFINIFYSLEFNSTNNKYGY
jgi:vacuolar protein sorting-associated protein 13A/C